MKKASKRKGGSEGGFHPMTCPHEDCGRTLFEVANQALGNPVLARLCERCEGPLKMLLMKQAENISAPMHHYLRCESCRTQFRMDIFPIKVHCSGCNDDIIMHPNWCLHKREVDFGDSFGNAGAKSG